MEQWTRGDFYGHSGELANEAAFRVKVMESAEHQREKRALRRREIRTTANTPWGPSQGATLYAEDVVFHSTAGHGGIHLSATRNRMVHPMLRAEAAGTRKMKAGRSSPSPSRTCSPPSSGAAPERTIKDSWPEAWERIFGTILAPGESREKDRRAFEQRDAGAWIGISAITSNHEKGMIEVVATTGSRRSPGTEERRFLIPSEEYRSGACGFVIDEDRHRIYSAGPDRRRRCPGK